MKNNASKWDNVIVLNNGNPVGLGTHEALVENLSKIRAIITVHTRRISEAVLGVRRSRLSLQATRVLPSIRWTGSFFGWMRPIRMETEFGTRA